MTPTLLSHLWTQTSLGELTELKTGPFGSALHKSDYVDRGIPVINPMHIVAGRILPSEKTCVSAAIFERLREFTLSEGDVVLGRRGQMGRCAVVTTRENGWLCGTGSLILRPGGGVLPRYLQRFLSSPDVVAHLDGASVGSTMVNLNQAILRNLNIPVPPLAEQKRIADKLDAVLVRVDACRERLDRVPAILKRFRQSILAAATSGALTEDWRAVPRYLDPISFKAMEPPNEAFEIPVSWRWVSVGALSSRVSDGVHKKPDYMERGIPFITVKNLTAGPGIDFSDTNFVTEQDHREFCKRTFPEKGDILISKDGTLGVVRMIETDRPFSIFVSVALVKPRDRRMGPYLCFALESPMLQRQMVGVGTGLQHIHLRDLRADLVPLPPLEEQTEIVRRVETLFAYADRLEARYKTAREQVERLTPALLAKAFRGELVPQDPNDEPASALLERLRAQRAERAPDRRRRKAGRVFSA